MFVCARFVLIAVSTLILARTSKAFDPFTAAQSAQALSGLLGGLEKLDEAADIGFALSDLLGELDVDVATDAEIELMVQKVQELNAKVRDSKRAGQDLNFLLRDGDRTRSLADRVRQLRQMIRVSKHIAALMSLRPKAGEKAIRVQQIRIDYMILEELMALRRMQFEQSFAVKEQSLRYQIALDQVQSEERRLSPYGFGQEDLRSSKNRFDLSSVSNSPSRSVSRSASRSNFASRSASAFMHEERPK